MLTLPIKRKWFDMILSGEKTEEYREIKPYWTVRFQNIIADYYRDGYDWTKQWLDELHTDWYKNDEFEVILQNGYSGDVKLARAKCYLSVGEGKEEWGAEKGKEYYILHIMSVERLYIVDGPIKEAPKRRFVMSDIHGCYNAFMNILKQIHFSKDDVLYIIGDMIDRGPDSISVLKYIHEHKNIIPMMGNHEWMMLQNIDGGEYYYSWDSNGNFELDTWLTSRMISEETNRKAMFNHKEPLYKRTYKPEAEKLIAWIRKLPYWIELDDYILVHAGWDGIIDGWYLEENKDKNPTFEDFIKTQSLFDIVWARYEFYEVDHTKLIEKLCGKKKLIVFGHTTTSHHFDRNAKIKHWPDKINIDCGCAYGGNLACLNLDTMEEYYAKEPDEGYIGKAAKAYYRESYRKELEENIERRTIL